MMEKNNNKNAKTRCSAVLFEKANETSVDADDSTFTDFVRFNKNVSPMKKHMKLARELNG